MPTGKPLKLTENQIEMIETMAGVGLSLNQMAAILKIAPVSLDRQIAKVPAVKEAILNGRAKASFHVRNTAFKMATSGKCPALTIFWLKCREGFMDKQVHEIHHHNQEKSEDIKLLIEALANNDRPTVQSGSSEDQVISPETHPH